MNDEDLRKTIEFIIEQQAQFAADIQQLRENQSAMARLHEKTDERLTHTESVIIRLTDIVKRAVDATERLTDIQQRVDPSLSGLTDRLNALINAVERIIARERESKAGEEGDSTGGASATGETENPPNA